MDFVVFALLLGVFAVANTMTAFELGDKLGVWYGIKARPKVLTSVGTIGLVAGVSVFFCFVSYGAASFFTQLHFADLHPLLAVLTLFVTLIPGPTLFVYFWLAFRETATAEAMPR